MTDLRKAAEQALEALESAANNEGNFHDYKYAANALRQALAQPEQTCCCGEPTALGVVHRKDNPCYVAQPEQDHGFDRTASHMADEYVDTNWDTSDMAHRSGGLSMEQENEAYGYAKRLAQAIWEKHYKEESPDWKPKNDVLGVLTQIDNMTCGLEKAQPEQEPTVPDNMQDWANLDGDIAWHLIDRHADNWADIKKMMDEFVAAKIASAQSKHECETCVNKRKRPEQSGFLKSPLRGEE